jgi:hypothetical protein
MRSIRWNGLPVAAKMWQTGLALSIADVTAIAEVRQGDIEAYEGHS